MHILPRGRNAREMFFYVIILIIVDIVVVFAVVAAVVIAAVVVERAFRGTNRPPIIAYIRV